MRINRGFLVWAAVISCGAIGCGPDIQGLCEEAENCRDGNEADIEACVAMSEYQQDVADLHGCTDEYNVWMDCFIAEASCDSQTKNYGLRDNNLCEAETNAYQRCN